jgi:hypothetical protein
MREAHVAPQQLIPTQIYISEIRAIGGQKLFSL